MSGPGSCLVSDVLGLARLLLKRLPALAWHAVSALFPRDRRTWVFFCWDGKRFSDNAKWLFLHCAGRKDAGIKAVLLTRSPGVRRAVRGAGFRAFRPGALKGIWYRLRAGVYVLDNAVGEHLFWGTAGAVRVNLWHGIPLKKIGRDIDTPGHDHARGFRGTLPERVRFRLEHPWDVVRYDLMVATSESVARRFSGAFAVPLDRIPVTGFPRNDVLLRESVRPGLWDAEVCRLVEEALRHGRRLVVYLPTFRDRAGVGEGVPIDARVLADWLEAKGALWISKPHTWDARPWVGTEEGRGPVRLLSPRADVYPLLRHAHVLVTDYSSVYFDFLLLERPVVFYAYDIQEYLGRDRGLYEDNYEEAVPGPVARTFEDLLGALDEALERPREHLERWGPKRAALLHACHRFRDDRASERVMREILTRFVNGTGGRMESRTPGGIA